MDWTEALKRAVNYIEEHLLEDISINDIAENVYVSSFHFQRGFKLMTGYTINEYIKNRRLYLAALEYTGSDVKVIDLAYKYGYDTPESFTKAFSRFHGVSPSQLKRDTKKIKPFLPLKISISIKGGNDMDYVVEKMNSFKVIGIEKSISYETSYQEIPMFWNEFKINCCQDQVTKEMIERFNIGEFGICINTQTDKDRFYYMIAGIYEGGYIPEGLKVLEIPNAVWVKFRCSGSLPGALQSVNTKIYKEWLPGNPHYELDLDINLEYYSIGETTASNYKSEIWLPVKER
ncbi:MAG: AraC family transcriptional regulator [Beduini sp.]|uniref:AraC family transcriptional regulator n=1 Tax=Beduini sp. TaxID=1922300 RepID=UPI0039A3E767